VHAVASGPVKIVSSSQERSRAYSRSSSAVLCARAGTLCLALGLGLSAGACSTSFQLGGLGSKEERKPEQTATVAPAAYQSADDSDLATAKAAAADLLARGASNASAPWENPRTGARGNVTPIATAYSQNGTTCQDFLASYIRGERESWYQGGACRDGAAWKVRDLRPLSRT